MTQTDLVTLYLTYTKPSAKRLAVIKAMSVDTLIEQILNVEWGMALID